MATLAVGLREEVSDGTVGRPVLRQRSSSCWASGGGAGVSGCMEGAPVGRVPDWCRSSYSAWAKAVEHMLLLLHSRTGVGRRIRCLCPKARRLPLGGRWWGSARVVGDLVARCLLVLRGPQLTGVHSCSAATNASRGRQRCGVPMLSGAWRRGACQALHWPPLELDAWCVGDGWTAGCLRGIAPGWGYA